MTDDLNFVLQARREKLDKLVSQGITPFAYRFDRSHTIASALELLPAAPAQTATTRADASSAEPRGPEVRLAGRLVAWRGHGKTTFAHLADHSGRIQLYFRRDELGEAEYDKLHLLDLGDVVGVHGELFRTKTGEITVRVRRAELLAKALRPLPFGKEEEVDGVVVRHSGFADPEARYRQRYADLAVHPDVRAVFVARSRMITAIRRFLDERGFLEVETPVLQPLYGGATARPFVTHHNALDSRLYLRIADELYLKRLIVGGFDRVYEIGHDFRNEGIDRTHNPEFTMLELYQAFADYEDMMEVAESLVIAASAAVGESGVGDVPELRRPFARISWVPSLDRALGARSMQMSHEQLRNAAAQAGIHDVKDMSRTKLLDELFQVRVESTLATPTFVLDYPRELSPLAKPKRGDPELTERFELFAAGRELANAFSELNDPIDQRRRFEAQSERRRAGDEEAGVVDDDYLRALEYGMPPTGGMGVGIDRLFMYLASIAHIRDVILFPILRPE